MPVLRRWDGYSQTVLVWVMTQYSILSQKLIFDGLFRLYFHCPHSAPLAFLTFFPFLFKSYSSFKTSSVASHLFHEALSITWPPHPELRIPTWIPLALKKWFTSNTHLIIVIPLPVCLLYHTVSSSSAGIICLPAPPTLQPISADSLWVLSVTPKVYCLLFSCPLKDNASLGSTLCLCLSSCTWLEMLFFLWQMARKKIIAHQTIGISHKDRAPLISVA